MRYAIIDHIRGFSVLGMILFHANYLLENVFYEDIIPVSDTLWWIIGKVVAILFILIAGASFALMSEGKGISIIWDRTLRRVAILSLASSSITIGTYLFEPDQFIVWGILHFFALASLIVPLFLFFQGYNIFLGTIIIISSFFLDHGNMIQGSSFGIPFGFPPIGFFSADYYPLYPWFGYFLIGIGLIYATHGMIIREKVLLFEIPYLGFIRWIGQHALLVYILHVPILFILFSFLL